MFTVCYVALGSNLGDSLCHLNNAIKALSSNAKIKKLEESQRYKSKPHGPKDQPDYVNSVVKFETTLASEALLNLLQKIENNNQRKREGVPRWGARTLDLDLLFYGDSTICSERLTVPHPRICERAFVLLPLKDLGASLKTLGETTIDECIKGLSSSDLNAIKIVINKRL